MIGPNERGDFAFYQNSVHFWPRKNSLMLARPNLNKTFKALIYLPLKGENSCESLKDPRNFAAYVQKTYGDAAKYMPTLKRDTPFPVFKMSEIKCFPWVK